MKPNRWGNMHPLPSFSLPFLFIFFFFFLFICFHSTRAQLLTDSRAGQRLLLFTQPAYNVSIFENSAARTYTKSEAKMGIILGPPWSFEIKYSIVLGDSEGIFQAEDFVMGDFCFLRICTNGGSGAILNREVQDNYTLTVKASAPGGLEALTTVYIKVLDTNDLRPLFSPTSYAFVVSESAPLGASIGRVTATDADVGSNGEFYYFFKNKIDLFAVHPTSGVITLTGRPRMDKQDRFELEVQVVDRGMKLYGNSGISSTARLVLTVQRVNEFAPVLSAVAVVPSWEEKNPVYAVINVEDKDEGISGDIEWVSIIEGDPFEQFVVDRSPVGNEYRVKTSEAVSWDTFPYGCNLTFQAKDRGMPPKFSNTQIVQLLVTKPDPVMASFEKDVYIVTLSEIAPPGSVIAVVKISPAPLRVNYSFSNPSDPVYFDINPLTGVIMTTRQLTRISQDFMVMEVVDMISEQRTSVQIQIEDANDNSPVFNKPFYNIVVNESVPVGTVVLVVSAVDDDKGENGYVSHTISGEQSLPFSIDQKTGEVRITRDLDFESSDDIYTFAVRASDWGSPYRRESEVNITIRVININDNQPLFEKVSCRGMISRDFPVNQTVVTLSAIDMDELGLVEYKILSGNELDYFNLNPDSGALSLKRSLAVDSLKSGVFNFKVVATDGEMFSDPTFVNISVVRGRIPPRGFNCKDTRVAQLLAEKMLSKASAMARPRPDESYTDIFSTNKQPPQFEALPTSILVREDLIPGASVFQVRARDGDTGFNGCVLFSISDGNKENCFNINMESGLITILRPLDRERVDRYFLNITIYDQGIPQMSSWRLLTVIIEDTNDNDPQFYQDSYSALVSENSAIGMEVITITAFDRDMGQNGQLSYIMLTSVPQFGIDSETGSVFVASQLDRETFPIFILKIEVRDMAERGTRRSSVTTLSVILEDVNDCAPAFIPTSYSARVLEDLPPGTVITWVQAQDPDIGPGGQVRYSLINDFNGTFEIGPISGVLRIRKELDFEKQQFFNLTLLAEDRGIPSLRSQTFVEVEVVDVNENLYAPYFSDFAVRGSVKENSRAGTSVMTVNAKDDDKGRDGVLKYSIQGGSGLGTFTIDEDTGVIYTSGILDCETKDSYWLTVCAMDRGVPPLSASVEVFIQVEDVNDNAPLTSDPIYHPTIMENSPKDVSVIRIQAQDPDLTAIPSRLSYRITAGNPQNFFSINPKTGLITTTARKLDREQQAEHFLEITVIDGPVTTRQSTVWVIVHVQDENDNPPTFPEVTYRISLPERDRNKRGEPVYRVFAYDRDYGANSNITYSIISGNEDEKFSIDPRTAMVSSKKMVTAGSYDILTIKAEDGGDPPLWSTVKLHVEWIRKPAPSPVPLLFTQRYYNFSISETATVAQPVGVVAISQSSTPVWFTIIGGRPAREMFYIPQNACGRNCSLDTGSFDMQFDLQLGVGTLVVAKPLDAEVQSVYNMTVQVTDGTNFATAQVFIRIQDSNDNPPVFSLPAYDVSVSEDIPVDMELLRVRASDIDERARLSFSIYGSVDPASMRLFRVNPGTGVVYTADRLDYEARTQHILTIMVKDQEFPFNRDLARILVAVEDSNDNIPYFTSTVYDATAYETFSVGTSVVQVTALDKDNGINGQLTYTIEAGNTGGVFGIDNTTGLIFIAKELDLTSLGFYTLSVRVTDSGFPPLMATASVRISLILSDFSKPKFSQKEYQAEIMENSKTGTYVITVSALSRSALIYDITRGNEERCFFINHHTGVITTRKPLDFEQTTSYFLVVRALSMAGVEASTSVIIQVVDVNDSPPVFQQIRYVGVVSEAAPINSVVLAEDGNPLVIQATDKDRNHNALLVFEIIGETARMFFSVDSGTGSIRTIASLDYETFSEFVFRVHVRDSGQPPRDADSPAEVLIKVININDSPPKFSQDTYETILLLPTYMGVEVLKVKALDPDMTSDPTLNPDKSITPQLLYSLVDSNVEFFSVEPYTGLVTVINQSLNKDRYRFNVKVWDGRFSSMTLVTVLVREAIDSGILFTFPVYFASIPENIPNITLATVVSTVGHRLNEPLKYTLLNPVGRFSIWPTCGAVFTTGVPFDREEKDSYELVVEVSREDEILRVARVIVQVQVEDVNDNSPQFVNLPYYAVVQVEAQPGSSVFRVSATDKDYGRNGQVTYSLKEQHRNFHVHPVTGELTLKRAFEADLSNAEYKLILVATDGGFPPLSSEVELPVSVANKAMPVFDKPFYGVTVKEDLDVSTSVLCINASSPEGQSVIFTITDGDPSLQFDIGFDTGIIRVIYPLDYETTQYYRLTVKATDTLTGAKSEVDVDIVMLDVNDNPPLFLNTSYSAVLSENSMIGTPVLQVFAQDQDTEKNGVVSYQILSDIYNSTDYFSIDSNSGLIYTARLLDYELIQRHNFIVRATDSGDPALSSDVTVSVTVTDTNDNPPNFSQMLYEAFVSELAPRGHFVTCVQASDADICDASRLRYSILSGNEKMTFMMEPDTGVLRLSNKRRQGMKLSYQLNVSVSDGVFTSTAQVIVRVLGANLYSPVFSQRFYLAEVQENAPEGSKVIQVRATDEDSGLYGQITYSFINDLGKTQFTIDADGVISTVQKLDRENPFNKDMVLTVMALDGGGRASFCTVRVVLADENDNAPRFRAVEYRMSIKANVAKGSLVTQIQATDPDAGSNGRITYSLYSEARLSLVDVLEVEPDSGWMMTKSTVDHLQGTVLSFFVKATDGGSPAKHSLVSAFIHVVPPDAFVPSFSQPQYSFTIPEDTAVGTALGSVYMGAGQTGFFSAIAGEMLDSNQEGTFLVEKETGLIRLVKPLDYEEVSIFRFKVAATTRRDLIESVSTVDLEVKILDVNDNKPLFETSTYVATVMEGMPVGTRVVQVRALDPDWGSNGQVTYSLGPLLTYNLDLTRDASFFSGPVSTTSVFAIDSKTGWITTVSQMDHEACSSYSFEVVASDLAELLPLSSTTVVTITVSDVNDNPPLFERELYRGAVKESDPLGEVVAVLKTKDRDGTDQNHLVSFCITGGNPRGVFGLALVQGEWKVYVSGLLDREQQDWYLLNITASDGLYVAHTAVEVTVMDANDNRPICNQAVYSTSFPEDIPINKGILRVGATDADSGSSAEIQYSLFGIGVEDFYMDANTGELRTAIVMDRELAPSYKLIAQATDGGGLFCRSDIFLKVLDVNDNAPLFSSTHYLASVYENASPKALLTRLQASDPDEGLNRTVLYSLVDSVNGFFSIDPVTGVVVLEKSLDRESQDSYRVRVEATDRAGQQGALSSQVYLTILVLDVNDNAPVFQRRDYAVTVPEDVAVGTEVVRVLATSADIGPNAEITYNIRSGNELGKFTIDRKWGSISVADDLDFEVCKDYYLTIEAWDNGNPPLSTATMVTIELMDVNDNAPAFSQDIYNLLVSEDASVGQTVTRVVAEDLDSQVNGRITYSILKGDRNNHFWIDPVAGLLKVNKKLDRELVSRYSLSVQAFDSGSPAMSSTVTINIDISDVNDNPPVFNPPNSTVVIQLNQAAGTTLLQLSVSDKDSPKNGPPFEFRIKSGNEGNFFSLDQTGTLRSNRVFGPEAPREFTLEIQATDSGKPSLSSSSWVFLRVIGNSQYKPTVSPLEIFIVMVTDTFPGGPIGRISATDRDLSDVLSFTQKPQPKSMFKVNRQDGSIVALPGLEPGRYQMNATVSDGRFAVIADVSIQVEQVTDVMLRSALTLRFNLLSPEDLLSRYLSQIKLTLRGLGGWKWSPGQQDPLHILSVQPVMGTSDVDLLLAMERPETPGSGRMAVFYSQQELSAKLEEVAAQGQIRGVLAGAVVVSSTCSGELECGDRVCENTLVMDGSSPVTYSTERVSLVSPTFSRKETCTCPGGTCPTPVELCEGQSCPADMQCVRSGPTAPSVCQCQPERLDDCAGQTSLSFSGNSYIKYRVTASGQSGEMKLGLRIRTLQRRGVIMFTRVNPCTMLKIEGGRLWFQLDCDNTLGIMGISGRPINDGLWHAVTLELTMNYTLLSLDDSYVERRRAARAPVRLWPLAPDSSFFFGAQVRPLNGQGERPGPGSGRSQGGPGLAERGVRGPPRAQDGFQGCLGSLMLNGNELPLQNKRSRYAEIAGLSEIKLGCVLYPDPCVSQPCLNGAICSSLPSGGFMCTCSVGFTGGRCEIELTSCMPNPCQNGGDCKLVGSAFLCGCPTGLGGLICDDDVNECDQEACGNGGECVNTFGSFYCNCSEGYEGQLCDDLTPGDPGDDTQAEPLSYVGPGEIIGIGVLAFVIIFLLILFIVFRKKIKFRKDSDPGPGVQTGMGISAISTETSYMLHKTGMGAEGIEFKAVRVSGSPATTSTYGEVGGSSVGPPQVMVRPTAHSPLPGGLSGDRTTSSEGSQISSFLSDMSNVRGMANRRGVAVCSVAPNLPSASACRSEHSPAHKVSWEGEEMREKELERARDEREEEWGQRAFELERTQRDNSPQDVSELADGLGCLSDSTSEEHSLSSYTSESFDDNASIVTVIRLVNDTVDNIESEVSNMDKEQRRSSPASHHLQSKDEICVEFIKEYIVDSYRWESSCQTSSWVSPSRLRPPELGSHYELNDTQQNIRRGGSTHSLQLDYRVMGYNADKSRERTQETGRRTFQWERNQSGEWERKHTPDRKEKRRYKEEGRNMNIRTKDMEGHQDHGDQQLQDQDSCDDSSSPVYEEYQESRHDPEQNEDTESLYDILPPTRRAYEGYPSSPPGLNLHPAQLMPPLRAWDLQTEEWRGSREDHGGLGSNSLAGSGDELERLLNLVSLRARRATRINRASTRSEPAAGWDGLK
ncbi:protocadherin Fat 3 isoform X1 [Astatotilapia calliptera]|uniref:protocadherin Fat 3 isoform X1 n=1 Tax=Astatotilapia calliptera TaxID=8154 RepID=UPI000E3FAAC7|nr:protocadherin Fat 3-like isoform X1 [Astatotilapia calliptera]